MSGNTLNLLEEQAFHVSKCAIALGDAFENRADSPAEMVQALKDNLDVWVAIRTVAERVDCGLSDEVRSNLVQLSNYVAGKTFEKGAAAMSDETLRSLVNINLQISEGLLEASARA